MQNGYLPGHFTAREPVNRYHPQIRLSPKLLIGSVILIQQKDQHGIKGKDLPGLYGKGKLS